MIRVATYNIHGGVGTDRKNEIGRVARLIKQMKVDLIGLQEVDCRNFLPEKGGYLGGHQLDRLAGETGMTPIEGPTMFGEDGFYGNAILSALPVKASQKIMFASYSSEPRGLMDIVVQTDTRSIHIINTHFGLRIKERRLSVRELIHHIEVYKNEPLILLGDFNEIYSQSRVSRKIGRFLKSPSVSFRTFPSRMPLLPLDRIWVSDSLKITKIGPYKNTLSKLASDHLPLVAEIDFIS